MNYIKILATNLFLSVFCMAFGQESGLLSNCKLNDQWKSKTNYYSHANNSSISDDLTKLDSKMELNGFNAATYLFTGDVVPENKNFWIQSAISYNRSNEGYWDLPGTSGTSKGANIQIWAIDGGNDRLFRFAKKTNGNYRIIVGNTSNGVVDVEGGKANNGTNIRVWEDNNSQAQEFYLKYLGEGRYKIYHQSGKIINLKSSDNKNGNNVQLWNDNYAIHGEWYLIDPSTSKAFRPEQHKENNTQKSNINKRTAKSIDLYQFINSRQTTIISDYFEIVSIDTLQSDDKGNIVKGLESFSSENQVEMTGIILSAVVKNQDVTVREHTYDQILTVQFKKLSMVMRLLNKKFFEAIKEPDEKLKPKVSAILDKMSNAK